MAYYSSSYYVDDHGESNSNHPLNSYYNTYDSAPLQDPLAYSRYNSNDYQNFACDPIPFSAAYDPVPSYSRIAYSVYTSSEPKHIEYDIASYHPAETQFIISYSVLEFNEPEFEEYDPTPYDGGYDLTLAYGKPLPPSDKTCYPRSTPDPATLALNDVSSSGVIATTSYGKDGPEKNAPKPQTESKPTAEDETEQLQRQLRDYDHDHDQESKEKKADDEQYSWSDYGNGSTVLPEMPYGYGLEAMDLCEGLFGYWPCLSRYGRRMSECQEVRHGGDCSNQRKGTAADYLFGSPNPYSGIRDDGNAIYGYERHCQQAEDSWST